MLQELFRIPIIDAPVNSFGVMMVLGFLAGVALARFLARRSGLDPEVFTNAAMIALVAGVVGARLSHVLENLPQYTNPDRSAWANLVDAVNMRSGGLTYYGGLLLATPLTIAYGIYKKVPIRLGMDIIAPCLMIGLGFGRVGCFLNGCCHGAECELPWAVKFPYHSNAYLDHATGPRPTLHVPPLLVREAAAGAGQPEWLHVRDLYAPEELQKLPTEVREVAAVQRSNPVHPAQLYSTLTAWILAGLLAAFYTIPHVPGRVFALMLVLEGATRFILELLRAEPAVTGSLSYSMLISPGLVVGGILMWFLVRWDRPDVFPPRLEPVPAV